MNKIVWRNLRPDLMICEDKYAIRYVEILDYRCVVFKFYQSSCTYSDTDAFWYEHYDSKEDGVIAAQRWIMRGMEQFPEGEFAYKLKDGIYIEPRPKAERRGW